MCSLNQSPPSIQPLRVHSGITAKLNTRDRPSYYVDVPDPYPLMISFVIKENGTSGPPEVRVFSAEAECLQRMMLDLPPSEGKPLRVLSVVWETWASMMPLSARFIFEVFL